MVSCQAVQAPSLDPWKYALKHRFESPRRHENGARVHPSG